MQATRETVRKWSNWLPEMVKNRERKEHPVWIVPATCCAMQYINHGLYLPGNAAPELERVRQARKNNVEFYQTRSPDSESDLMSFCVLAIRGKRNIGFVEERSVRTTVAHRT